MAMNFESRTVPEGEESSHMPPLSPEELAEKFGQFEILECLGRGGMGVVYKARQKSLNRTVAIKILAPEREHDARFAERFAREAELLARLSHPHIVTIHDFGQTGGLFYLVMEYVDGVNLRELLRDGKIEPEQALAIVPPICDALQYAHDKGIVHRDIKPENLLLDRDGRVKIADFGIASLIGAENESAGTPTYMAPEQADASRKVDHRADIYALGVVLYEMLTGERPGKEVVAPSSRMRGIQIDVRLDEIVLRALEKEPGRRYQTVGEFRTVVDTVTGKGRDGDTASDQTHSISQEELDALSGDSANWRFAIFYFCRQDPRIVAPKRTPGFGWTVNLANPWAVPFMVAIGFGIIATLKLMRATGLWTRPYQIGTFAAILTVIVWICHRLSRGSVPRKGSPSPLVRTLITLILAFGLAMSLWKMPSPRSFEDTSGESGMSSEAVNRAPAPMAFGALTEREISPNREDAHGLTFFSLSRGEVVKPPFPVKFTTTVWMGDVPQDGFSFIEITPRLKGWAKEQKVDLVFAFESKSWHWQTLETRIRDGFTQGRSFDSINPAEVIDTLTHPPRFWNDPQKDGFLDKAYVPHVASFWNYPKNHDDAWSRTFHIFKTRTDQAGVMEIIARPAGEGVKLRYKLVQEPGAPLGDLQKESARPSVAEERYSLKVQFGESPDDPALTTDIQLGVAFSAMKREGQRVLSIDGRIDLSTDGLYRGELRYLDVDASKTLSVQKSGLELVLEPGVPFRFMTVNGIARFCVVTLTRKQPDDTSPVVPGVPVDFLRSALMTIPPIYLGDIPLARRKSWIDGLESDPERMDAARGWMHQFGDGSDSPGSSMIWLKILPRGDKAPVVFVHMAKPFAAGGSGRLFANQTFVLERDEEQWKEVTQTVIPATVDLTKHHFRTRKEDTVIEVAPWKAQLANDRYIWTFGERVMDLWWNGEKFTIKEAASKVLTNN